MRAFLYGQEGGMRKRHSRARICKPFKEPKNRTPWIDSQLAGRYDNPFWRIGPPGYIGRRNRFLGIDSLGSIPGLLKRLQIRGLPTTVPVSNPDPDPPGTHVLRPPGSGSISQRYGSAIRIRILLSASKNSKKNLDSYCFVTSFGLFIFEIWCKCTFKEISSKTFF